MNRLSVYSLFMSIFLLVACDDFLEEMSQDEVRPSQVTDLEQILLGDGYVSVNLYYATEIFTDNIYCGTVYNGFEGTYETKKWQFLWEETMFDEDGGGNNVTFWSTFYEGILGCNLVLDYLDDMEGDDNLRENLRGEALALRSWYYFHLVNLFGIAYNQGNPETNLGVPLKLSAAVEVEYFPRNTVAEVYAQIEEDLLQAASIMKTYPETKTYFRINHLMANALLSRVYLYMEDWDNAIAYADSVLNEKPELLDLNTISTGRQVASVYGENTTDEIIWARDYGDAIAVDFFYTDPWIPSDEIPVLYARNADRTYRDLRGACWLNEMLSIFCFSKGNSDYGGMHGIRTAELYLNRAEAYTQKYIAEGNDEYRERALSDLNKLRKARIDENYYTETDIVDGHELLNFVIDERRRELAGESSHRWCDVRRYGIVVKHELPTENIEEEQDMSLYVLPIPQSVLDENPLLQRN